jgi:hypothetical protein
MDTSTDIFKPKDLLSFSMCDWLRLARVEADTCYRVRILGSNCTLLPVDSCSANGGLACSVNTIQLDLLAGYNDEL